MEKPEVVVTSTPANVVKEETPAQTEVKVVETANVVKEENTNTNNNSSVPYERFKEVNDKKNSLEDKIKQLEATISTSKSDQESADKSIADRIDSLEKVNSDKITELKDKYENTLFENAGVEDPTYLGFLAKAKMTETDGLTIEDAIAAIKSEKPALFTENKKVAPGQKPQSNQSGKIPYSEWELIKDRKERTKLMNEGKVDLDS